MKLFEVVTSENKLSHVCNESSFNPRQVSVGRLEGGGMVRFEANANRPFVIRKGAAFWGPIVTAKNEYSLSKLGPSNCLNAACKVKHERLNSVNTIQYEAKSMGFLINLSAFNGQLHIKKGGVCARIVNPNIRIMVDSIYVLLQNQQVYSVSGSGVVVTNGFKLRVFEPSRVSLLPSLASLLPAPDNRLPPLLPEQRLEQCPKYRSERWADHRSLDSLEYRRELF
jgi:hypothetical protein